MSEAQVQISEVTPELIRAAIKRGDRLMVFDGGEPIALITGAAAELGRRRDFFVHYPHEASECFGTCWRHDGRAEAEAVPAGSGPVPVPA
jgi:antitoxin (DNA-binding transcriptional repressor) of toxin-antitoxin stability system